MTIQNFSMGDDELAVWLGMTALTGSGFGPKSVMLLLDRFGGEIQDAWKASREELRDVAGLNYSMADKFIEKRNTVDVEKLLNDLKKSGILGIPYTHALYPYRLREIHDPPLIVFVNGALNESDFQNVISVVGTRSPTSYGQKLAKDVARDLSAAGAVVASGLAIGIDSLAHWGAIEGGGRTIAVVATGPDLCYPSSNRRLMKAILDGHGVILSEYFPGTKAEKFHFPARNRIVSGLARGVVVVEAGENSGALITAQLGFEQSREIFAFPGRVDSPMSAGTNRIIHKTQASLVRNYKDILDGLCWVTTTVRDTAMVVELFGREKEIFEMLSNEPMHFDVLCERSGINAGELSAALTMLELAGVILRHSGDWYSRRDIRVVSAEESSVPKN